MNQEFKIGDIVYCSQPFVDTEYGYKYEKFAVNNRVVHTTRGKEYKINNMIKDRTETIQIEIKNDFGIYQWYDLRRFSDIKMIRKMKLQRLQNIL